MAGERVCDVACIFLRVFVSFYGARAVHIVWSHNNGERRGTAVQMQRGHKSSNYRQRLSLRSIYKLLYCTVCTTILQTVVQINRQYKPCVLVTYGPKQTVAYSTVECSNRPYSAKTAVGCSMHHTRSSCVAPISPSTDTAHEQKRHPIPHSNYYSSTSSHQFRLRQHGQRLGALSGHHGGLRRRRAYCCRLPQGNRGGNEGARACGHGQSSGSNLELHGVITQPNTTGGQAVDDSNTRATLYIRMFCHSTSTECLNAIQQGGMLPFLGL